MNSCSIVMCVHVLWHGIPLKICTKWFMYLRFNDMVHQTLYCLFHGNYVLYPISDK